MGMAGGEANKTELVPFQDRITGGSVDQGGKGERRKVVIPNSVEKKRLTRRAAWYIRGDTRGKPDEHWEKQDETYLE